MKSNIKTSGMDVKATLSALWIFVLLNIIFRDIHELFRPGFLEEIMTGTVNGVQMTQEMLLIAGILLEIPIVMVILSRVLKDGANRWANIIAGALTIVFIVVNNTAPDLDDIFFATIEVLALALIIWFACTGSINPNDTQALQYFEEVYVREKAIIISGLFNITN